MDKNLLAVRELFKLNCRMCHGKNGIGIKGLGAPLDGSDWVRGDKSKLLSIVLYGLTGPIKVGDKTYAPPEVTAAMPATSHNDKSGDKEIALIVSYIRNVRNNKAGTVTKDDVKSIHQKYHGKKQPFTMKVLWLSH